MKQSIYLKLHFILAFLLLVDFQIFSQQSTKFTGKVSDINTNRPIVGANIIVDGLSRAVTNFTGFFELSLEDGSSAEIIVSHIGYKNQSIEITDSTSILLVLLEKSTISLQEVEIKVSREEFSDTQSIERLNLTQLKEIPAIDFYSALSALKDIDVVAQGLQFQSVNSRGFAASGNARFLQIIDGMDNQSPGLGFAIGNFNGLSEIDLESVEIRHGPESSRFGTSAFNGVMIMHSKDPFLSEGFSFSSKLAANRFNEGLEGYLDRQAGLIYDNSFRFAKVINQSFAFKVNASVFSATDWIADDLRNINAGDTNNFHPENPAYNGINVYGDESSTLLQSGTRAQFPETQFSVTRTGYRERELVDYDITNYKAGAAIHYNVSSDTRLILQGNFAHGSTMYTGDNRIYLGDMSQWQSKLEINNPKWMVRGYTTNQNINNAFDSRFLALHLNRSVRSDQEWFSTYELIYNGLLISRGISGQDHVVARVASDGDVKVNNNSTGENRLIPGDPLFNSERENIINTQGFDKGAGFTDHSKLYHIDGELNISDFTNGLITEIGGNFRFYDPESGGVILADSIGNDITMHEYGFFIQTSASKLNERLKGIASVRFDKNENFNPRLSPRFSLLYNISDERNIRISFQSGFRYPTIKEQFAFQQLGNSVLIGGLLPVYEGLNLFSHSFYQDGVELFNNAVELDSDPFSEAIFFSREQAELRNLNILEENIIQEGDIKPIVPEKVSTIEVGYRGYFLDKKLYLDINGYVNFYKNFIGILRVVKPATSPSTDLFISAGQLNISNERKVFFMNSNSKGNISSQGISMKIDYNLQSGLKLGANATWSHLSQQNDDPLIPGFNTPGIKGNVSLGFNDPKQKFKFRAVVRMRDSFSWQSNFGDGRVDGYALLDIQLTREIPSIKSILKLGISNLFNTYYTDVFGGAQIGAIPFIQLNYQPSNFNR